MTEINSRRYGQVQETFVNNLMPTTYLGISMPLNVHLCKRTNISDTNNIDSEISEEIHDIQRLEA